MPRKKPAFSQSDLTRWVKAFRAAGDPAVRVEIKQPDGSSVVISAGRESADLQNPCDRLLRS